MPAAFARLALSSLRPASDVTTFRPALHQPPADARAHGALRNHCNCRIHDDIPQIVAIAIIAPDHAGRKFRELKSSDCAVVIIGGGPCGLMLAIELGRRGISIILLEEKTSPARFPAANATQARTMEHYRRLGFAEKVRAQGLPPDYPTDIAYFTRFTKHELARFSLPSARAAREMVRTLTGSWSAAELPHRVSQMFVEDVLRAEATACPTVSIRPGWRDDGDSRHRNRRRGRCGA